MANSRLKKLINYLIPHKKQLWIGVFALLVVNTLGVYIPILIRDTINDLQAGFTLDTLGYYAIVILVLASIMWGIRMISRVAIFGIGRQVEFDLKQKIFRHLLKLEPSYFAVNTSGDLMNRATSDVDNIRRLLGFAVLSLINTIFAYILTLPVMLSINVRLSLMAIAVYPLMLITVQLFSDKLRLYQQEVQENLSEMSELIQEDMSGMALIKIYAQEENEKKAFEEKNQRLLRANLKLARTRNILFPLVEGLSYLSLLVLLWLGTKAILAQEINVGDFIALILLIERLVFPTALLGFTITTYQRGEVSIDRIETIFEAKPQIKNEVNALSLPQEQVIGELQVKNLVYAYPDSTQPALKGINFTIKSGETIAIVGPIGSGKSTLANAIPRLLNVEADQIFLDGLDITKLKLEDLRKAIAFVPQDSFLFSTTIQNNIRYGDPLLEQNLVEIAAQKSQIHNEILNFPKQYETLVGERGITLSGGQRQRTSLARALIIDSPILILDDALSSVDNETATAILKELSSGTKQKTVLFISHQMSAAASADRILVMDQGKIVQVGTHQELLNQEGLYQSLWQQHQLEEILH
jgi:ATP-binding cassette, subfamily B, multidrug efflux pump